MCLMRGLTRPIWHLCSDEEGVLLIIIELLAVAAAGAAHREREDHVGARAALVGGGRAHRPLPGRPLQQRRHAGRVLAVHGLQVRDGRAPRLLVVRHYMLLACAADACQPSLSSPVGQHQGLLRAPVPAWVLLTGLVSILVRALQLALGRCPRYALSLLCSPLSLLAPRHVTLEPVPYILDL